MTKKSITFQKLESEKGRHFLRKHFLQLQLINSQNSTGKLIFCAQTKHFSDDSLQL